MLRQGTTSGKCQMMTLKLNTGRFTRTSHPRCSLTAGSVALSLARSLVRFCFSGCRGPDAIKDLHLITIGPASAAVTAMSDFRAVGSKAWPTDDHRVVEVADQTPSDRCRTPGMRGQAVRVLVRTQLDSPAAAETSQDGRC